MRFHLLQHVAFEGPAAIKSWTAANDHTLTSTKFYQGDLLPAQEDFDFLVVMGGPMGVEDVQQYPWLVTEREFIRQAVKAGKYILGICLGAQLIAMACGAEVVKNDHREIGWFKISIEKQNLPIFMRDIFPATAEVFHWHSDTFEMPDGADHFAMSDACSNQGFILDDKVIGLQFHIETTEESAALLINNCGDELDGSSYVQSGTEMLADAERFKEINQLLYKMLQSIIAHDADAARADKV